MARKVLQKPDITPEGTLESPRIIWALFTIPPGSTLFQPAKPITGLMAKLC